MAWTYTQSFDSLTTADLTGQDSWSGNALFDVVTTAPFGGSGKCVSVVWNANSSVTIDRTITGISSGRFYYRIKVDRDSGTIRGSFEVYSSTTLICRLFHYNSAGTVSIDLLENNADWRNIASGLANDEWITVGIEFDDSAYDNKYRANVNGGAWSSWYVTCASYTTIDKIRLTHDGNNGSGAGTIYFDAIEAIPEMTVSDYIVNHSTLKTGLKSFWPMREQSGTRYDAHGSNDLTASGTGGLGSVLAQHGYVPDFINTESDYLSVADTASVRIDDTWSVSYEFRCDSIHESGNGWARVVHYQRSGENGVGSGVYNDSGVAKFAVMTGAGSFGHHIDNNIVVTMGVWHYVTIYFNGSSTKVNYDGTEYTFSTCTAITAPNTTFYIGCDHGGTQQWDGAIRNFGIWEATDISGTKSADLYNGGRGMEYGIAIDNYTIFSNGSTGTTWTTGSLTVTGDNSILMVAVMSAAESANRSDLVASIKWGGSSGQSMTKLISEEPQTSGQWTGLWYLLNPARGANTLYITTSESFYGLYVAPTSFSGVDQNSSNITPTTSGDDADNSLTLTLTTAKNYSWTVSALRNISTGEHVPTAPTVKRGDTGVAAGDSNKAIATAGSTSQTWTGGAGNRMAGVMTAIVPLQSTEADYTINMSGDNIAGWIWGLAIR